MSATWTSGRLGSLVVMGGYWFEGLWTTTVTRYYLVSLPAIVLAIFAGRFINRRMHGPHFLLYIHSGPALIGAVLLMQALSG